MEKKIRIGNRYIGAGEKTYIVAEVSANHLQDYNRAEAIMRAAAEAGADAVKLQTYTADTMTIDSDKSYFQIEDGTWKGENLYHLYERAYTPWEWQEELKEEAEKIGLDPAVMAAPFISTIVDVLSLLIYFQFAMALLGL